MAGRIVVGTSVGAPSISVSGGYGGITLDNLTPNSGSTLSSYQSALASGYSKTEAEFYQALAKVDQYFYELPPLP